MGAAPRDAGCSAIANQSPPNHPQQLQVAFESLPPVRQLQLASVKDDLARICGSCIIVMTTRLENCAK